MNKKIFFIIVALLLVIVFAGSCKRTYFQMSEEVTGSEASKFRFRDAYYRMGKSIALTAGRFELTPADSMVLFIEGRGKTFSAGEEGVAALDVAETARFYIVLPPRLSLKEYDTRNKAICEITGSLNYGVGENLFICQSGSVVIDSLRKDDIFGSFKGNYLNTSNKSFQVEGPFKATLKQ